jgi:SM-20-related protein
VTRTGSAYRRPVASIAGAGTTSLFARLGFCIVEDFFDHALCTTLLSELRAAPCRPAEVYRTTTGFVRNDDARRTGFVNTTPETETLVVDRLTAAIPSLAAHFELPLERCQTPYFLRYGPGDFFGLHTDRNRDPDALDAIQRRLVSVIIFLNDQHDGARGEECDDRGTYAGGDLTFTTRVGATRDIPFKVPLRCRGGTLAAFPALVPHEVRPVTHGNRYTIVSWYE